MTVYLEETRIQRDNESHTNIMIDCQDLHTGSTLHQRQKWSKIAFPCTCTNAQSPRRVITTSSQLCIYYGTDFASITKIADWAAGATAFIKAFWRHTRLRHTINQDLTGVVHLFSYRVMVLSLKDNRGGVNETGAGEALHSSPSLLHPQMPHVLCTVSLSLSLLLLVNSLNL